VAILPNVQRRQKEIKEEACNTPEIAARRQVSSKTAREVLQEHPVMDKEIHQ